MIEKEKKRNDYEKLIKEMKYDGRNEKSNKKMKFDLKEIRYRKVKKIGNIESAVSSDKRFIPNCTGILKYWSLSRDQYQYGVFYIYSTQYDTTQAHAFWSTKNRLHLKPMFRASFVNSDCLICVIEQLKCDMMYELWVWTQLLDDSEQCSLFVSFNLLSLFIAGIIIPAITVLNDCPLLHPHYTFFNLWRCSAALCRQKQSAKLLVL